MCLGGRSKTFKPMFGHCGMPCSEIRASFGEGYEDANFNCPQIGEERQKKVEEEGLPHKSKPVPRDKGCSSGISAILSQKSKNIGPKST